MRLRQRFTDYLRRRTPYFIITIVILIMGVVFGALAVKALNTGQRSELWQYLSAFFANLESQHTVESPILLRQAALGHLRTLALIAVLGLSVIGSPLILLFLFTRGFVIGFSVGFLVEQMVFKGVLMSIAAVLPQNLLIVPALIFASVACLDFAVFLVRGRVGNRGPAGVGELGTSALVVVQAGGALMLASLIEAYVCPVFLEVLGRLLV